MSYLKAQTRSPIKLSDLDWLKQIILILLLALVSPLDTLHAQSGRGRSDKGAGSTGISRGNQTSSDSAAVGSSTEDGAGEQGETVEGDVLRINTSLVTVPVNVKDRNGRYIPDLGRDDFHLFEEGVEQKIAYFATVDQPFTLALVMDTSNSTNFKLEDIQAAAIAFVNQLKSEDRVMVISFDDKIRVLTEPTNDRAEMIRAIRQTRTGNGTRLYDAVEFVLKERLKQIEGRKAMVLFTDGIDTTSHRASYKSTVRLAEEQDALVYPVAYDTGHDSGSTGGGLRLPLPGGRGGISIGLPFPRMPGPGGGGGIPGGGGGGGATREEYQRASAYLRDLAQKTGGRFYNGDTLSAISQAFAQVAEELRLQYSLGYYPQTIGPAGARRQIKVRINQPNLVVTARDSYIYAQKETNQPETNGQPSSKPSAQGNHLGETR